jgi:predicted ribosome quality control (RQC) complex YloA/Tae2 family protein
MEDARARVDLQRRGRTRLSADARQEPERLALEAAQVADLAREVQPLVRGLVVRDVVARPPADIVLVLARTDVQGVRKLLVSADPEAPRLALAHASTPRHDGPLGPFFRRVAEELVGAHVAEIAPVAQDRIAIVELRESPTGERRALLVELFGRHANLVLLGPGDVVVDLLVPPPAGKNAPRLTVGKVWVAPQRARAQTPEPADASDAWAPFRAALGVADPHARTDTTAPLSALVERVLGAQAETARHAREEKRVLERLTRKLERARSLASGLDRRLAAAREFERVREDGELVKTHLGELKRGLATIEVDDFFAGEGARRTIALDPKLAPLENLQRLFDKAKKLERSLAAVEDEIRRAHENCTALAELEARCRAGADPATVEAEAIARGLLEPAQTAGETAPRRVEPAARLPYKSFHALRGAEIRVGRTARDNDTLTFKHARGSDVWLHTADTPGSHVVLRITEKGREPDPEELIDAAHLAVHFSPLRGAGHARVHVARQKEVHKPRGAKAGLVTLSGGKILDLRVQPERLQRLLGTHRPGANT